MENIPKEKLYPQNANLSKKGDSRKVRRHSRERKKSNNPAESSEESYNSILHKLVHSKRLSLEASGNFPQVKPNSLFCAECSKNMLSYVAVLQDMLDVVVGDISHKGTVKHASCPHCVEKVGSHYHVDTGNQHSSSQRKSSLPNADNQRISNRRKSSLPNVLPLSQIPTFQPDTSVSENIGAISIHGHSSSYYLSSHSQISESVLDAFNASKRQVPNKEIESVNSLESSVERQVDNFNAKDTDEEFQDAIQNVIEVKQLLENFKLFGDRIPVQVQDKPLESSLDEKQLEVSSSNVFPVGEKQFENYSSSGHLVTKDNSEKVEENKQLTEKSSSQIGETVRECWKANENVPELHQMEVAAESEEAFVTLATNNLNALSSLVLGYSLLAAKTSRTLVVLVTERVCPELRYNLSTVFNIVQSVESLGMKEITKLTLMEDPELGISFVKLHVWQLRTFRKCVFLDPSTLVVRNCDELFKREELSAVPDIGWPDCFNSGVFVYAPSLETFWDLIDFVESQESYDGGDQGLLNMYFKNWSTDISRKLPFIYNMMANVSYTYKPAFKQFGKEVKIVHFFGSYKPWNVPFHSVSGNLLPTADVHPTYVQFVKFWLDIFVACVMPLFDEEVLNYCHSQKYVTAQELLRFFPSTPMPETLPIQPSFRLYPESMLEDRSQSSTPEPPESEETAEDVPTNEDDEFTLPGAELGDYRGMEAWEQGRADYLGQHKSDRIMARLDFLMQGTGTPKNTN